MGIIPTPGIAVIVNLATLQPFKWILINQITNVERIESSFKASLTVKVEVQF